MRTGKCSFTDLPVLGLRDNSGVLEKKHVIWLEIPKQRLLLLLCTNQRHRALDLPAGCLLGPNMLRTHLPRQNPQTVTGFAYAAYYGARNGVNPSPSADPLLETRGPMLRAWGAPSWTVRPPSDVPARARVPCSVPPWGNSQNNTGLTRCSENSTGILLIHLIALLLPHEAMKPHASYIPSSCTKIKD
jgi:hypothetical protein